MNRREFEKKCKKKKKKKKICLNSTIFQINRDFTPTRQSNRSFITFKLVLTNNKQIYLNMIKMNKAINFNLSYVPFSPTGNWILHTRTSIQCKSLCWNFAFCNNELFSVEIWSSRRYFFQIFGTASRERDVTPKCAKMARWECISMLTRKKL